MIYKTIKKHLLSWGIPAIILILLMLFGVSLIRWVSAQMIWLYYNTIDHPKDFDVSTTGQIGDTYGGTTGPYLGLVASYLTFIAFWIQFRANEQQKEDLKVERFENKFYELIGLHRNNVNEISIGESTIGRKAFISLFNELKFTYILTRNYYQEQYPYKNDPIISDGILYNIAYLIFFFGCGPNSTKIVLDLVGEKYNGFLMSLEEVLKANQAIWRSARKKGQPIAIFDGDESIPLDIKYVPFNGHMSKISHYFRHIFQIVKMVDEQYPESNNYDAKYNYITTLRAQLSTFEQLLIYYNALSILGKPWVEEPEQNSEFLLKKYCLVKSMPLTLANFYRKPADIFGTNKKNKNGKVLFEWNEIKERINHL